MADMKDRLIELLEEADNLYSERLRDAESDSEVLKTVKSVYGIYADHLLANGVILPPCKVGDTVYKVLNDKRVKSPYECKVVGLWLSKDENCNEAHLVRYVKDVFDCSFSIPFTEFGKTVFLTREEAEKALREKEK